MHLLSDLKNESVLPGDHNLSGVHIPSPAIKVDLSEFWISIFICILNVHGRCFTPPADCTLNSTAYCAGLVVHPLLRN